MTEAAVELVVKAFSELSVYELFEIYKLRASVFVVEQKCCYQDVDEADKSAYHVFFRDGEDVLAYLRVLPADISPLGAVHIGRVIAAKRKCGLGRRIVSEGIKVAKEKLGAGAIKIGAQTYARGFYEKCGFVKSSDEYIEDGIPHIVMTLQSE